MKLTIDTIKKEICLLEIIDLKLLIDFVKDILKDDIENYKIVPLIIETVKSGPLDPYPWPQTPINPIIPGSVPYIPWKPETWYGTSNNTKALLLKEGYNQIELK